MATKLDLRDALLGNCPVPLDEIWIRDSDVVLVADEGENTLLAFRNKRSFQAPSGRAGEAKHKIEHTGRQPHRGMRAS